MPQLYTIGHSIRSPDEFLGLLQEHGIERLVDVRRFPASRRHPHFAGAAMAEWLSAAGVAYVHEVDLGGRRKGGEGSPNTAWRVAGFRAYADHMNSPEFRTALERVIESARKQASAIMCAEAVPWRCHRQLIADALTARGLEVLHIFGPGRAEAHRLNPAARIIDGDRLIYPALQGDQIQLFRRRQ